MYPHKVRLAFNSPLVCRDRRWQICLVVSLLAALFYSFLDLQVAFAGDWIVQDDARQHVFWMTRYVDPQLFPNDLIADYFQSVAPWGYTYSYKLGIYLGIDPFVLNKLFPIPVRIVTAYYFFAWCSTIFPIPSGCLTATLLLNHSLWLKNDIVSATPRAFLHPFFLAFLYYFNRQALIPCSISLIGLGLFYPQMLFIACEMLLLKAIGWLNFLPSQSRLGLKAESRTYISSRIQERNFAFVGLIVSFLVLLPYALKTSDYAPIITRAEALTMPEFQDGGRSEFFKDALWEYLVGRGRAVMVSPTAFRPYILVTSLFLPLLVKQSRFSLVRKITPQFASVAQLLLASLGMYMLAHIFLFKLHLPSRYTGNSLRIVANLCAGITITSFVHYCWRFWKQKYSAEKSKLLTISTVIAIAFLTYSNLPDPNSRTGYEIGSHPQLYKYLQQQPKDIVVASLTKETNNIPSFSQRSVLVSSEYAIPYQLGYYQPFKAKVRNLIQAQYSLDLAEVRAFINRYNITHWLIEDRSFDIEYVVENSWLEQYKTEYDRAIANLESNQTPALLANKDRCTTFTTAKLALVETKCLLEQ